MLLLRWLRLRNSRRRSVHFHDSDLLLWLLWLLLWLKVLLLYLAATADHPVLRLGDLRNKNDFKLLVMRVYRVSYVPPPPSWR